MSNQVVYIELDTLLDTRIGIASLIDKHSPIEMFANGYFDRNTDRLWELTDKFSKENYLDTYVNRDVSVLEHSHLTKIINIVATNIDEMARDCVNNPLVHYPKVYVNTYPYSLPDGLKIGIKECLTYYLGNDIEINIGYLSPINLTPVYINNNFHMMFMYDFLSWYKPNGKLLVKTSLNNTIMFLPKILKYKMSELDGEMEFDGQKVNVTNLRNIDPFDGLAITFAGYLNFNFLDAKEFSVALPNQPQISP